MSRKSRRRMDIGRSRHPNDQDTPHRYRTTPKGGFRPEPTWLAVGPRPDASLLDGLRDLAALPPEDDEAPSG